VLVIRGEQMRVLVAPMRERFVDVLQSGFATLWPAQTAQLGSACRSFLNSSIDRATSYGIRTEQAIARFINLYFVWGPNFDSRPEHAWAVKVLKDPAFDGTRKVDELVRRTTLKLRVQELNKRPPDV